MQHEMHQFDNFFESSKIEEEVTLELILPNFSGKWAFLLNLIVLYSKYQIEELQFCTVVHDISSQ